MKVKVVVRVELSIEEHSDPRHLSCAQVSEATQPCSEDLANGQTFGKNILSIMCSLS